MKRVGSIKQAFRPSVPQKSSRSSQSNNSNRVSDHEYEELSDFSPQQQLNNNDGSGSGVKMNGGNNLNSLSILGNSGVNSSGAGSSLSKPDFHFPKSISSFLKKGTSTLTRKKSDKTAMVRILQSPSARVFTL